MRFSVLAESTRERPDPANSKVGLNSGETTNESDRPEPALRGRRRGAAAMSEAKYREIVARMAMDTEFAQSVMADPDGFAASNGLTADEAGRLRAVRVEAGTAAPSRLGTRLSKTGFGGAHHALHHDHHVQHHHHEDDSHYEHDSHTESDQHHQSSHHGHQHEDDSHYEHDEHTESDQHHENHGGHHGHHEDDTHYEHDEHVEIDTHTSTGPHGTETDTHFEEDEHTEYDSHYAS
jgi:hypothetical protein